jgi:hypothetical protein
MSSNIQENPSFTLTLTNMLEWRDHLPPFEQSISVSGEIRLTSNEWQELESVYRELKAQDP